MANNTVENVVIVVVDALRADRVGAYGYHQITPHIDQLASDGTIFTNAFSTTNATDPAITSLLTGKYPISHGVLNHGFRVSDEELRRIENVDQIQQLLSEYDYKTFKTGRVLGRWQRYGFDVSPDVPDDRNVPPEEKISVLLKQIHPSLQTVARELYTSSSIVGHGKRVGRKLIESTTNTSVNSDQFGDYLPVEDPFFTLIHLDDTHVPYEPQREIVEKYLSEFNYEGQHIENILRKFDEDSWIGQRLPRWVDSSWDPRETTVMEAKYDAAIHEADTKIGSIIHHLNQTDQLDHTMVVVLSDHGESLGEHEIYYDHHGLYDSTIQIPLIIRMPFDQHQQCEELVQIHDIAPTILSTLPIDKSLNSDGKSLLPLLTDSKHQWEPRHAVLAEEHHAQDRRAIRTKSYKYIKQAGEKSTCRYCGIKHQSGCELYSLIDDPDEKQNIYEENQDTSNKMNSLLEKKCDQYSLPEMASIQPHHADEEAIEDHLRDLGYI